MYSEDTTKYLIHAKLIAEGVVERTDVVGAFFGQTEGLLGEDLDLHDLQRSGRISRIDINIESKHGKTVGKLSIASSLDRAETAILAAAMETVERIGPCSSKITIENIEDLRVLKRRQIVERAKTLLLESFDEVGLSTKEILEEVREASRVVKISSLGEENLPAGPSVEESDALIILEGRADVLNLLRCGIKNTVAVEGAKVPDIVAELSKKKVTTVFVDGDRGGDLILKELLQVADVDYVAFSQRGRSVEDMTRKEIMKSLKNKIQADILRKHLNDNESIADFVLSTERDDEQEMPCDAVPTVEEPSLGDYIDSIRGTGRARVLTVDNVIIGDYTMHEFIEILPKLESDAYGIIIDAPVTQKILDRAYMKGISYIASSSFKDLVHLPASIQLIQF
ncbi:MAG TPA: DNA primase DnaG [Methanocorpusculum sp.]|nr:DNA primase DnaG [Methanocorpusculum sp.]HJJ40057.1 DNA primase DnaG [Methanocorpusculum sp.]HJJ49540.1 DNA primase DnaG [Methanocorpusculum sp.]HJJ57092.1 DNA primase DnaG [Methanocorpusculum sp.]HJJ94992.1 DNA primase DnaG [Methanocorpusculum sp.]